MKKIPKEIVEMIEQRNALNKKIHDFLEEIIELDDYGMDGLGAEIVDKPRGKLQGDEECREWCEQWVGYCEDDFYGNYYWETEVEGKYLKMDFEC